MPKSRGRKPRPPNKNGAQPKPAEKPRVRWTFLRKTFAGCLIVATVLGGFAAVVTFLPRLTIDSPEVFDPAAHTMGVLQIRNTGVVPLYDVKVALGICGVSTLPNLTAGDCKGKLTSRFDPVAWHHDAVGVDEQFTITLDDAIRIVPPAEFGAANISVIVLYQPWLIPWQWEFEVRFMTKRMNDGKIRWFARPASE